MPVMPSFLGVPGGMREDKELNSYFTVLRETEEETAIELSFLQLGVFAQCCVVTFEIT
jgi:ADP-ribose pyrophosphatase YjhB (NUDIX family)